MRHFTFSVLLQRVGKFVSGEMLFWLGPRQDGQSAAKAVQAAKQAKEAVSGVERMAGRYGSGAACQAGNAGSVFSTGDFPFR